ncbi:MAG: hypothetical protein C4533_02090 [Candidatus Omnitrophota bacterium]|nr:MAG: hypothetical protein C4533_02090 [Candidatus Omnitrophota bacterium]
MRLTKFLTVVSFITVLSLVYVYQQTEIFRLAYLGQNNQNKFQELLDKNTILRYNINKEVSLINIDSKLSRFSDFQIPDTCKFVRVSSNSIENTRVPQAGSKKNVFAQIFSVKRQAEARTINSLPGRIDTASDFKY